VAKDFIIMHLISTVWSEEYLCFQVRNCCGWAYFCHYVSQCLY
jgi:hypothetical protein